MKKRTVVEIAMEIALTPEILKGIEDRMELYAAIRTAMSTSVGGIGPLLRERTIAQAELGANVIGITLLYDRVWVQRWHAWGQFYLEKGDSAAYVKPLLKKMDKSLSITMPDEMVEKVHIWVAEYGKAKVYFLDSPKVANIVYPGPEDAPVEAEDTHRWASDARIKQSWFLGRGSLALLKMLDVKPDVIVLSETPTLFGFHDLVNDGLDKEALFKDTKYIFNDHTPMEYAHPVWSTKIAKDFKIKSEYYKNLSSYKDNPDKIDITQLLVNACDGVYGVSKRHGEVMRNMHTLAPYAEKIETITNGVSRNIWQADIFREYKKMTDEEVLDAKKREKEKLVDWMWHRYKFSSKWRQLKKDSPIVLWMRRVTGYKRLDILKEIVVNSDSRHRLVNLGITMLLGGRIHQNDAHSDWVVFELLDIIQKYPELEDSLILLDNFNVYEAPRLYRGVDAAIMISDQGREASATGFMKAQLNGAMVIATDDGAVPESVCFYPVRGEASNGVYNKGPETIHPNGFLVEYHHGHPTANGLLTALEEFKKVYDDPTKRVEMMRASLDQSPKIDIMRTAKEMLDLYSRL